MIQILKYLVIGTINMGIYFFIKIEMLGFKSNPGDTDMMAMALFTSPIMFYFYTRKKKEVKTINCPYCSKEISENSKVCNHCNGIV